MSKPQSKRTKGANAKNSKTISAAIASDDQSFARVEKNLGGKNFHVNFFDGEQLHTGILAKPRGLFGRVRVPITVGSFVVLEGADIIKSARARGQEVVLEIYGVLDKPTADQLYKSGRIHSSIYKSGEDTLDDLFEAAAEGNQDALDIGNL